MNDKSTTTTLPKFDPNDDNDPNRPLAILSFQINSNQFFAGNIEIFQKLQHVTSEVVESLNDKTRIDLFKPEDEEEMNLSLLTTFQTQNSKQQQTEKYSKNQIEKPRKILESFDVSSEFSEEEE